MGLPVDATLGEKIRFYRQQAGLTQKGLADLCEVSESAIRNYELGNRVPDFLTLKTIAEQLRVSYYAIADVNLTELDGAVQALFKLKKSTVCTQQRWMGISILSFGTALPWRIFRKTRTSPLLESAPCSNREFAVF